MAPREVKHLDLETIRFYRRSLETLKRAGAPFLVGGAYAMTQHGGIVRHTKDLDVFLLREHLDTALEALSEEGCRTEVTFPHWLAKAHCGEDFVDLIFSSGNGLAVVDEEWFAHAPEGQIFGVDVLLCPPEEMLWSKATIMERERYDGADVAHLLLGVGDQLDWARLIRRFGPDWRVLLSHLVLFGFIYPGERHLVPQWVLDELMERLRAETGVRPSDERVCQGTLLSRAQYLVDVQQWGYRDARVHTRRTMTPEDAAWWTAAIDDDEDDRADFEGDRAPGGAG